MAKPPESTKTSLRQKLASRAAERWPQLAGLDVRWRGQFAYVAGQLPDGTSLPLFRLRYADSASTWGFAIYRASHDDYETSLLPSGWPAGTPQEALDCACGLYLGDHTAWLTQQPDELTGAPTRTSGTLWRMGRKSREKVRRRTDPLYHARIIAERADARGNRVQPTVHGFEEAARVRGSQGVVEALIARHNQRWSNVRNNIEILSDRIVATLHVVFPMDVFLWKSGVRFTEPPPSPYGDWEEHLRWAIDSACQSVRMVLACNPLGAAAISRTQLERWSANRSTSSGREQRDGAATDDHYTTIWNHENPRIPAGEVWNELSEALHGRGGNAA